jgi:hypothetical protein
MRGLRIARRHLRVAGLPLLRRWWSPSGSRSLFAGSTRHALHRFWRSSPRWYSWPASAQSMTSVRSPSTRACCFRRSCRRRHLFAAGRLAYRSVAAVLPRTGAAGAGRLVVRQSGQLYGRPRLDERRRSDPADCEPCPLRIGGGSATSWHSDRARIGHSQPAGVVRFLADGG